MQQLIVKVLIRNVADNIELATKLKGSVRKKLSPTFYDKNRTLFWHDGRNRERTHNHDHSCGTHCAIFTCGQVVKHLEFHDMLDFLTSLFSYHSGNEIRKASLELSPLWT